MSEYQPPISDLLEEARRFASWQTVQRLSLLLNAKIYPDLPIFLQENLWTNIDEDKYLHYLLSALEHPNPPQLVMQTADQLNTSIVPLDRLTHPVSVEAAQALFMCIHRYENLFRKLDFTIFLGGSTTRNRPREKGDLDVLVMTSYPKNATEALMQKKLGEFFTRGIDCIGTDPKELNPRLYPVGRLDRYYAYELYFAALTASYLLTTVPVFGSKHKVEKYQTDALKLLTHPIAAAVGYMNLQNALNR